MKCRASWRVGQLALVCDQAGTLRRRCLRLKSWLVRWWKAKFLEPRQFWLWSLFSCHQFLQVRQVITLMVLWKYMIKTECFPATTTDKRIKNFFSARAKPFNLRRSKNTGEARSRVSVGVEIGEVPTQSACASLKCVDNIISKLVSVRLVLRSGSWTCLIMSDSRQLVILAEWLSTDSQPA